MTTPFHHRVPIKRLAGVRRPDSALRRPSLSINHLAPIHPDSQSGFRVGVNQLAFSLIEILVTVALLSVIILGLVAMFNQTQRAFLGSMNQADVLEGGRSASELMAREIEQMVPGYFTNTINFNVSNSAAFNPVAWPLAGTETTVFGMDQLYFLTRDSDNQQWKGIGYAVMDPNPNDPNPVAAGIGTLYRYEVTNILALTPLYINYSPVIDGVVDFRVRAYDKTGNLIVNKRSSFASPYGGSANATGNGYNYSFTSNAVPAYVEIELGVLETRSYQRWLSLAVSPTVALDFLTNHAGQVHITRLRIPIRAVDPAAYQ